jgi:hypothetical protein
MHLLPVAGHGPPSETVVAVTNGRLDGFAERSTELTPRARRNLWHLGADLFKPGGMAGPGVLTAGGGSGCWSRLSGSSTKKVVWGHDTHIPHHFEDEHVLVLCDEVVRVSDQSGRDKLVVFGIACVCWHLP